jgi:hypothetical protein
MHRTLPPSSQTVSVLLYFLEGQAGGGILSGSDARAGGAAPEAACLPLARNGHDWTKRFPRIVPQHATCYAVDTRNGWVALRARCRSSPASLFRSARPDPTPPITVLGPQRMPWRWEATRDRSRPPCRQSLCRVAVWMGDASPPQGPTSSPNNGPTSATAACTRCRRSARASAVVWRCTRRLTGALFRRQSPDTGRPQAHGRASMDKLLKNQGCRVSRHNGGHKPILPLILLMFFYYRSPCAVV